MWTLVGIGMVMTTYGHYHNPEDANAQNETPLAEASYSEWVEARAEWLKTTDEWKQYVDEEAKSVVNTKAQSDARIETEVYRIMTAERIATSTDEEITN